MPEQTVGLGVGGSVGCDVGCGVSDGAALGEKLGGRVGGNEGAKTGAVERCSGDGVGVAQTAAAQAAKPSKALLSAPSMGRV